MSINCKSTNQLIDCRYFHYYSHLRCKFGKPSWSAVADCPDSLWSTQTFMLPSFTGLHKKPVKYLGDYFKSNYPSRLVFTPEPKPDWMLPPVSVLPGHVSHPLGSTWPDPVHPGHSPWGHSVPDPPAGWSWRPGLHGCPARLSPCPPPSAPSAWRSAARLRSPGQRGTNAPVSSLDRVQIHPNPLSGLCSTLTAVTRSWAFLTACLDFDVLIASVNELCWRGQLDFRRPAALETHVAESLQTLHGSDDDLVVQPEAGRHFHAVHAVVHLLNPP